MKIKVIRGDYNVTDDIKPFGHASLDENGNPQKCYNCKKGIEYPEWETGKLKCTICLYAKY